jgi:hypothetical protein
MASLSESYAKIVQQITTTSSLTPEDVNFYEINGAFSRQMVMCMQCLDIEEEMVSCCLSISPLGVEG